MKDKSLKELYLLREDYFIDDYDAWFAPELNTNEYSIDDIEEEICRRIKNREVD